MSDELDRLIDAGSVRYVVVGLPVADVDAITGRLDAAGIGWLREDGHLLVARSDEVTVDRVFEEVLELDATPAASASPSLRPDGELRAVFEDNSQFTVELMRQRLEDAGIASAVVGGPGGGFTEVPMVVGLFQLRVHQRRRHNPSDSQGE